MRTLRMLKKLFIIGDANVGLFIVSSISVIIASFFVLAGIGLIIPVLNSLAMGGDFLSNLKMPILENFIRLIHIKSDLGIFTFLMLLILSLLSLSTFFLLISAFCMNKFSTDIEYMLRAKIFARYLSFEKSFYAKAQSGFLISIVLDTATQLRTRLSNLHDSVVNVIMALAYLSFLLYISWKITILTLPILILIYYSTNWLTGKIRASFKKYIPAMMALTSRAIDVLQNIILVKSYSNEKNEHDILTKRSDQVRFHIFNAYKKEAAIPLISDFTGLFGLLSLIFIWVVIYIKARNFSLGNFLVYFFVLRHFVSYAKGLNTLKGHLMAMGPVAEKILWVFDDSDKEYLKNGNIDFLNVKEKIQFKDLNFRYIKERQILKNINFTIQKGQTTAIIGPTGSGKTTIANLMCRFYDPESGSIEIDGIDIRDFTLQSLRKSIAIVTQDTMLFNDTIKNNIIYGIDKGIAQEELDEVAKKAHLYDFVMNLPDKYNTYIGDRGVKLSGGEKQRLAIARAMIKNTDILILDEATSALDSETEMLIQEAIKNLTQNKTVLAIAHRLSTIKHAEHIIVLEDGKITEQGSSGELLEKKGRFYYYWNLQKFF